MPVVAGRLAAVTASSGQVSAAEGFSGWLTSSEVSSRVGPASGDTTLFRASQQSSLKQWVPGLPAEAAGQYFQVVQQAQSRARSMSVVRLPGSDRYSAALDAAVERASEQGQDPQQSLSLAADEWRKITAELGTQAQRAALSHSLKRD